jgi:hypothetical protein
MKRFAAAFRCSCWPWRSRQAPRQVKEVPGDTLTVSGTEAIDHTTRALTLKNEAGELVTIDVSPR